MTNLHLKELLDYESRRINCVDFIDGDPVKFPRRFSDKRDIEIASLLTSTIAWGKRTMICRDAEKMFALMDWEPYRYVIDRGYEDLPDMNIHRTFFASDLRHYLRGLAHIYDHYASLEDFAAASGVADSEVPSWSLAAAINIQLANANGGCGDSRCLPLSLDTSALKRFNMALRWLVRDDGIVDMGVWSVIKPSQLYIPLDVHVGNTSRKLGLLERRANDRRAVVELTEKLRLFNPEDPVVYDYALFGLGVYDSFDQALEEASKR